MLKKIFIFIFLIAFFVTPLTVSAQFSKATTNLTTVGNGTGLVSDLNTTVSDVIKGVLSLAGTIFLVLTVYAGILWMTAQGNEEQVTKAKGIVTQAIIGLAITLAAYAITAFVTGKLAGNAGGAGDGSPSGSGGSGGSAVIGGTCEAQGGECNELEEGKNVCKLEGFNGTVLGGSCQANEQCCELDWDKNFQTKCTNMGGTKTTGSCGPVTTIYTDSSWIPGGNDTVCCKK